MPTFFQDGAEKGEALHVTITNHAREQAPGVPGQKDIRVTFFVVTDGEIDTGPGEIVYGDEEEDGPKAIKVVVFNAENRFGQPSVAEGRLAPGQRWAQ